MAVALLRFNFMYDDLIPWLQGPCAHAHHSWSTLQTHLWFGLVNLLRCGWAFCPSHFVPTVKWGPPRNAKLNKH